MSIHSNIMSIVFRSVEQIQPVGLFKMQNTQFLECILIDVYSQYFLYMRKTAYPWVLTNRRVKSVQPIGAITYSIKTKWPILCRSWTPTVSLNFTQVTNVLSTDLAISKQFFTLRFELWKTRLNNSHSCHIIKHFESFSHIFLLI